MGGAEGDCWIEVATMEEAAEALGPTAENRVPDPGATQARRVRPRAAAPLHRPSDRPPAEAEALADRRLILARGPFALQDELALMRAEKVETLVTKNSGGRATYPKIEAARMLGVDVVVVKRPKPPEAEILHDVDAVMAWIASHRGAP